MSATCSKCRQRPGNGGRGLCENCWAVERRKLIAYGRWEPDVVDSTRTRQHLAALQHWGMGTRRIQKLTGLARPTLQAIPTGQLVTRNTESALLAIPLPSTVFDPILADGTQISSLGSQRRLRALASIGWGGEHIGQRLDVRRTQLSAITGGRQPKVTVARARAIAALFSELQMTPGPSRKTRRVAEIKGWPMPFHWDEDQLDNPDAKPDRGPSSRVSAVERITELHDMGVRDPELMAERLGVKPESVGRQLLRMREAS